MATYHEKLLDPRWQKKRLKIMERAGFCCENCGNGRMTLHIHHGFYKRGFEPWDYPDETLKCLCADCHEDVGVAMECLHEAIARTPVFAWREIVVFLRTLNDVAATPEGRDRMIADLVRESKERLIPY